jgi:DNA-binding transcriptional MerR regulator
MKMYKINEIAELSGISTRTLRYYDQIDLLKPSYISKSGYRYYNDSEVEVLQLILFYKKIGYSLRKISRIIHDRTYSDLDALYHIKSEIKKTIEDKENILLLVERTLESKKAGKKMKDIEKFEALKKAKLKENTNLYGDELAKYDQNFVRESYKKYQNRTENEIQNFNRFTKEMHVVMKEALTNGDPQSNIAMKMCEMHKNWLMFYWPKYSAEAHLNLTKMYTEDDRFKKHYEDIAPGLTDFLYSAIKQYLS